MIVYDDVAAGDPLIAAAVDDCQNAVDDVLLPLWGSGIPRGDPLQGLGGALAIWLSRYGLGPGPADPKMVLFAERAGASMRRPMQAYWEDEPL